MANEPVVELELSKEVTHFLNKKVGTEKATASKVFSLLQNAVEKKNRLEVEVRKLRPRMLTYDFSRVRCREIRLI